MEQFQKQAGFLRRQAERLGVALEGGWSALGDAAVWLCGMERILYGQADEPRFLEALLDVLLEWELWRMDLVLAEGVDAWVHMAWYEGVDFWSPKNYRRMLKPRLEQLRAASSAHGIPSATLLPKDGGPCGRTCLSWASLPDRRGPGAGPEWTSCRSSRRSVSASA
jgi:hypothetical protein